MASFMKRKRCEDCGNSFSSSSNYKRHKGTCPSTEPEPASQDSSDDDEEVYFDEDEIDDLLQSFQPRKPQQAESSQPASPEVKPFFKALILWTCFFLCIWQSVFYISSNAIAFLLKYLHALLAVAAQHYKFLAVVVPMFPSTIFLLKKLLRIDDNNFFHYVVCPACCSIYRYSDCISVFEGEEVSMTCSNVSQPNHPMRHYRQPCGAQLLQSMTLSSGKKKLVPHKNYYFKSLKDSLFNFLSRPGFEEKCEQWRDRVVSDGTLHDVYDGRIWKSFSGTYLKKKRNYGLMLNLDWFQPFKHVKYSVGVMYLVILNLPREERYKRENVIIVGIIPHMKKEPPTNSFVQPLVDELLEAWTVGFSFNSKIFRLALMCIGCDIPACRKLCGFLGHAAVKGCSRCKKSFPGEFGKRDYSGFDRTQWIPRTHEKHIREIRHITSARTKTDREALASSYGTRYSVLSELPYLDLIKMSVVDPMHNLFLGTSKHMLHVWRDTGVLTDKNLDTIQAKVDAVNCPSDIGRIPHKISSGFAGFSADQFKNWTLLFSVYALKDVISDDHLECWRNFVLACRYLCCRVLTENDIKMADLLLISFCENFERLYGRDRVTPNMHLHGHLIECVQDFGPIYSFWLFSFERFNGMLGDYTTNKKSVELQLMRRFVSHSHLLGLVLDDEFHFGDTLEPIIATVTANIKVGTLGKINSSECLQLRQMSSRLHHIENLQWTDIDRFIFSKYKVRGLTENDEHSLQEMYRALYGETVETLPAVREIKTLYLGSEVFGSAKSQSVRSSYITAYWTDGDGKIGWGVSPRPGKVLRYLQHSARVDGIEKRHILAEVQWYRELEDKLKNHCGRPVEAWHSSMYVDSGPSSFMPIQRIKGKFVKIEGQIGTRTVTFVSPRDRFVCV
ncbi:uncharacterized protein LOC125381544 [Haliotis rufescens]|uniref:uncharacterized protein LOC125381542 n=1 Tax=Haliotis rufescens TaxID=6454 RepID=UPI00201F521F|nr:uncharacterized protein LOC125381542 [Haliotis rufescens]XP_048254459.1 uncharacterized protein LOC125381544 [Haliotis rufescens]